MSNLNILLWSSVSLVQLLLLHEQQRKSSALAMTVTKLTRRVRDLELDIEERFDKQVHRHLINSWESDEEYDPR